MLYPIAASALLLFLLTTLIQRLRRFQYEKKLLDSIPTATYPSGPNTRERQLVEWKQLLVHGYEAYSKHGRLFKLPNSLGGYRIILPVNYLKEIRLASGSGTLSWQKVMHDILAIRYTGSPDRAPFSAKVLRTQVTKRLDKLAGSMLAGATAYFDGNLPQAGEDYRSVQMHPMFLRCIAQITIGIFCGEELANDDEWREACLQFTNDSWAAGMEIRKYTGITRHIKSFTLPRIKRMTEHKKLARRKIGPLYRDRLAKMNQPDFKPPDDAFQWLLEAAGPGVDFETFVQTMMRVVMAALHTTAGMATLAFADLLYRPEYKDPLIEEIREYLLDEQGNLTSDRRDCDSLRKLDSFIKESARFSPIALTLAGRKIMGKDHVFSDGTTIPAGNTMLAPGHAILHDADIYEDPETFKPWRFAEMSKSGATEDKRWMLANATEESLNFGYGAQACPGRWFASQEIKIMFAKLLLDFDTKWGGEKNGTKAPLGVYTENSLQAPTQWYMLVKRKKAGNIG